MLDCILPSDPHPFVDRQREINEIVQALQAGISVNLYGWPGVGKTRLAKVVAQKTGDFFAGRCFYATLDPNFSLTQLKNCIAAHFSQLQRPANASTSSGYPPVTDEALQHQLADSRGLIILDNVSHAPLVSGLLRALPSSYSLLVISRKPLSLDQLKPVPVRGLEAAAARCFVRLASAMSFKP